MGIEQRNVQANKTPISDTSPLVLTRYWEVALLAITAGTPKYLSSDGAGDVLIPHDARFVRIQPIAANAKLKIQNETTFATKTATTTGSMQAIADQPEWFQLPVSTDRVVAIDMLSSGNCLITFGG